MLRPLLRLALACLAAMTLVLEAAAAPRVWVAVAEEEGAYAEAAAAFKAELADGAEISTGKWQALFDGQDGMPDLIVTVGVAAFDGALGRLAQKGGGWARVPVLATLLPQAVFEARMAAGPVVQRPISAVVLDQPLGRQMALIKRALPDRRHVGVLSGTQTRPLLKTLEKEAHARDLKLGVGARRQCARRPLPRPEDRARRSGRAAGPARDRPCTTAAPCRTSC